MKCLLFSFIIFMVMAGCGSDPVATTTDESPSAVAVSGTPGAELTEAEQAQEEESFESSSTGAASGSSASGQDTIQLGRQTFGNAIFE
jgi:uncharacterized protein YceK